MTNLAWLLSLLLAVCPPGKQPLRESAEAGELRYQSIAADVEAVAMDESEAPLFGGPLGRERTEVLLLAVAYMESGFRSDVDSGATRGDSGRSCTLWQLQKGQRGCAPFVADRRLAAREALHAMRRSAGACRGNAYHAFGFGVNDMLRVYASGNCLGGEYESAARVDLARRWFSRHPPPLAQSSRVPSQTPAGVPSLGAPLPLPASTSPAPNPAPATLPTREPTRAPIIGPVELPAGRALGTVASR